MPGMITGSIGCVTIDSKYNLVAVCTSYSLAIVPYKGGPQPSFDEIAFYANCLAYEHEIPVSIFFAITV